MKPRELFTVIDSHIDDWRNKTDTAIADEVNAWEESERTQRLITSRFLIVQLGRKDARIVLGTLIAGVDADPVLRSAYDHLNGAGLDFDAPFVHEAIDELATAGGWSEALKSAVHELGITRRRLLPGNDTVNATDVRAALDWRENDLRYTAARTRATVALDEGGDWTAICKAFEGAD